MGLLLARPGVNPFTADPVKALYTLPYWSNPPFLGRVALVAQRPIVVKLSRERSVGRSVCLSVQCIVEKRRIRNGCRLAP